MESKMYFDIVYLMLGFFLGVFLRRLHNKYKDYKILKKANLKYRNREPITGYSFVQAMRELKNYISKIRPRTETQMVDKPFKVLMDCKPPSNWKVIYPEARPGDLKLNNKINQNRSKQVPYPLRHLKYLPDALRQKKRKKRKYKSFITMRSNE